MTDITETFFNVDSVVDPLHDDLKKVLKLHANSHPRGHQRTLGPSEVGHPCTRKMVQSLMFGSGQTHSGYRINTPGDPLPSYVGTAAHKQFEAAIELDNEARMQCGEPARWISEKKVTVRQDLSGTCDLYDIETATVIDLKFPGTTAMNIYKKDGPSLEYRTQAHCYGAGYINEGYPVRRVGIWFLPRAGQLASSHLWLEDYDQSVVDEVLSRIDMAHNIIESLEVRDFPARLKFVPTTPHHCVWCPYFSPVPGHEDPTACQGDA